MHYLLQVQTTGLKSRESKEDGALMSGNLVSISEGSNHLSEIGTELECLREKYNTRYPKGCECMPSKNVLM